MDAKQWVEWWEYHKTIFGMATDVDLQSYYIILFRKLSVYQPTLADLMRATDYASRQGIGRFDRPQQINYLVDSLRCERERREQAAELAEWRKLEREAEAAGVKPIDLFAMIEHRRATRAKGGAA